jgi:hypothetical protein
MGEQLPQVDESKFNAMQAEAAAAGPEAEARRREMQRWSDATGAYAEEAAIVNKSEEERLVERGDSPEDVRAGLTKRNAELASSGVFVTSRRHGGHSTNVAKNPGESTMVGVKAGGKVVTGGINGEGIVTEARSPATIRNAQ